MPSENPPYDAQLVALCNELQQQNERIALERYRKQRKIAEEPKGFTIFESWMD